MARGLLAQLQHQAKVAARAADQASAAHARQHAAAVRDAERARQAAVRASAQLQRGQEAERKRLEKEALAAHVASMQADVEEKNAALAQIYDEIDSLLASTLEVDDFVDLENLRRAVEHPPFDRAELERPGPPPAPIPDPPEPVYFGPEPPKGLFGKKKKLAEATEAAHARHAGALGAWRAELDALPARRQAAADQYETAEADRIRQLEAAQARYAAACAERDAEVAAQNAELDALIANLGYGATAAVEEYISIVLSNSVYPEHFPVRHEFTFDPGTAELSLRCLVPGPTEVPAVKAYKYTRSSDEISETALPQTAAKTRYAGAVNQVALRSLHEVFEADRRGLIRSISLEVGTETIDPATGIETYVPFVAVAAEGGAFSRFDLSAVVPTATLTHLGAAVSKNPLGLVPADVSGIRKA